MEFQSDGDLLFAESFEPAGSAGAGPDEAGTLVLLHPTPLDHRFWLPVAKRLPQYSLLIPDLRGHGRSGLGAAPLKGDAAAGGLPALTVGQLARDAVALLDAVGIEKAIFVGCSIGGYTLYELWRTAPSRVAGAVFCNCKPYADNDTERAKREHWIATHASAPGPSPTVEFVDSMLAGLLAAETREHRPALVAQVRSMMEQVSPAAVQAIQRGLAARPDSCATAASVAVRTCVIAGEEDGSSTPADMLALRSLLAAGGAPSAFHLLPRSGHYAPFEQPETVAAVLADFCHSVFAADPA